MLLKSLKLENFRNHIKGNFNFFPIVLIEGKNGSGKTNLLESILFLSYTKSPRAIFEKNLISWGKDWARVSGNFNSKEIEIFLEAKNSLTWKIIKLQGVKKSPPQVAGLIKTVYFSPEDLSLVSSPPSLRRRFLDFFLISLSKKYFAQILDYQKILKERNKLLERILNGLAKEKELSFWDKSLVEIGSKIILTRQALFKIFNPTLGKTYKTITKKEDFLEISYLPSVKPEKFNQILQENRRKEIEATATLFGPHRDDFLFLLNSRPLIFFGSRGEIRLAIFSLKIAEAELIKRKTKESPLLLLDDIFSELDSERKESLAKIIGDYQTLITTTNLNLIPPFLRAGAKIISLTKSF